MTTRKIMVRPCMVKIWLYCSAVSTWPFGRATGPDLHGFPRLHRLWVPEPIRDVLRRVLQGGPGERGSPSEVGEVRPDDAPVSLDPGDGVAPRAPTCLERRERVRRRLACW